MKSPKNEQHDTEEDAFNFIRHSLDPDTGPECKAHIGHNQDIRYISLFRSSLWYKDYFFE